MRISDWSSDVCSSDRLASQGLAEAGDTGLCGSISRVERRADEGDARSDVYHHRVPALAQCREGGSREVDRRDEVDIDHGLKLDLRDILQTARPDATGVVDEDVEAAEGGKCLFERRGTAFGRRDIGYSAVDLGAPGLQGSHGFGDDFRAASADRHFRPLRQQYRSEEPTSELHSLMRKSYAVFCLKNT